MGNSENISPKDFNKTRMAICTVSIQYSIESNSESTYKGERNKQKKGGAPHMERRKYTCLCLYLTSYTGMQFPYVVEKFAISVHHR